MYATSFHEQSSNIITFAQFEEGHIVENEGNIEEYKSIFPSTDESSKDNDSDDRSVSTKNIEDIWDVYKIHLELNTIYYRFKIRDCNKQTNIERKGEELSAKNMGKYLHIVFKDVVNELNN